MTSEVEIREIFIRHGYHWKIDGELKIPTAQDIRETIDKMKVILSLEKSPTAQGEIGHLIIRKYSEGYDVFVHIGDENGI